MFTRFLIQTRQSKNALLLTSYNIRESVGMSKTSNSQDMASRADSDSKSKMQNALQSVPNVLIVTSIVEHFNSIHKILRNVLDQNRYLIYHLDSSIDSSYLPTKYDTSLVINLKDTESSGEPNDVPDENSSYSMFKNGLNVVTDNARAYEASKDDINGIKVFQHDDYEQLHDTIGNCSFVKVPRSLHLLKEKAWLDILKSCFPLIKLQHAKDIEPDMNLVPLVNFFGDQETLAMLKASSPIKQKNLQLDFNPVDEDNVEILNYLPIRNNPSESFNWDEYQSNLNTKDLGRNMIHCNVITSTFDLLQGKFLKSGLVVIADQQTSGKGRSANKWLSPKGCAMFSLQLELSLKCGIGKHMPLLQHLVSLAVVDSINSMGNGYENLDLRLKWPNDIYAGQHCKIGGVVVFTSIIGSSIHVNVGCGVNLSNDEPTKSINQMAKQNDLPPISRESFLSQVFNKLEYYLDTIGGNSEGEKDIFNLYHKYWLHGNQSVKLRSEDGTIRQGRVISLDSDGFLLVEVDGHKLQVHPDGNSFDMLQGLILPKK